MDVQMTVLTTPDRQEKALEAKKTPPVSEQYRAERCPTKPVLRWGEVDQDRALRAQILGVLEKPRVGVMISASIRILPKIGAS